MTDIEAFVLFSFLLIVFACGFLYYHERRSKR
jgi:hypothetical protein